MSPRQSAAFFAPVYFLWRGDRLNKTPSGNKASASKGVVESRHPSIKGGSLNLRGHTMQKSQMLKTAQHSFFPTEAGGKGNLAKAITDSVSSSLMQNREVANV